MKRTIKAWAVISFDNRIRHYPDNQIYRIYRTKRDAQRTTEASLIERVTIVRGEP